MNIFVSGGAKNGKSSFAQNCAFDMAKEGGVPLYYIATMIATDQEDERRIARHIEDRDGMGFITIEEPYCITSILKEKGGTAEAKGVFLLDSVTALLSNVMFQPGGIYVEDAGEKVATDLVEFAKLTGNAVFVSDYIYSEARIFDDFTENYRRSLAYVDRQLAKICDRVCEVQYGVVKDYK